MPRPPPLPTTAVAPTSVVTDSGAAGRRRRNLRRWHPRRPRPSRTRPRRPLQPGGRRRPARGRHRRPRSVAAGGPAGACPSTWHGRLRGEPSPGRSDRSGTPRQGRTPPGGPARAAPGSTRRNSDVGDRATRSAHPGRARTQRTGKRTRSQRRVTRDRSRDRSYPARPTWSGIVARGEPAADPRPGVRALGVRLPRPRRAVRSGTSCPRRHRMSPSRPGRHRRGRMRRPIRRRP